LLPLALSAADFRRSACRFDCSIAASTVRQRNAGTVVDLVALTRRRRRGRRRPCTLWLSGASLLRRRAAASFGAPSGRRMGGNGGGCNAIAASGTAIAASGAEMAVDDVVGIGGGCCAVRALPWGDHWARTLRSAATLRDCDSSVVGFSELRAPAIPTRPARLICASVAPRERRCRRLWRHERPARHIVIFVVEQRLALRAALGVSHVGRCVLGVERRPRATLARRAVSPRER
jgi:hypothetical protein